MKKVLGFCVLVLIAMNVVMCINVANTEVCADRWNDRVTSFQQVRELNMEILRAHEYSESLIESVRMLALENGLLCERNKAATEVVIQFEGENHRLKVSLSDACKRLEEQLEQINKLIDEVEALTWQVRAWEKLLDKVNSASDTSTE